MVNTETIALNKDHIGISKFGSSEDEDYVTVSGHLRLMIDVGPERIAQRWKLDAKHEGM
jgi:hypothetical protein